MGLLVEHEAELSGALEVVEGTERILSMPGRRALHLSCDFPEGIQDVPAGRVCYPHEISDFPSQDGLSKSYPGAGLHLI